MQPPSILILTRNEEVNIADCLRALSFSDDIVVLDSLSTDKTVDIAMTFPNVRVIKREFDTEWKQRNFGLHDVEYKHPWVYVCDADERVPKELADELMAVCNDPANTHTAMRLRYRNIYLGKWIRHASTYPVWIIRLVQPKKVSYEVRETNVHPIVDGSTGELNSHFIHYSFNGGLARWFYKHNFYSTREAMEGVRVRKRGRPGVKALRSDDPMLRRRTMKNWSYFLIGRAFWRFIHQFFIRMGFLDLRAGFHYCVMIAMYEYWIEVKINEFESHWHQETNKTVARLLKEGA